MHVASSYCRLTWRCECRLTGSCAKRRRTLEINLSTISVPATDYRGPKSRPLLSLLSCGEIVNLSNRMNNSAFFAGRLTICVLHRDKRICELLSELVSWLRIDYLRIYILRDVPFSNWLFMAVYIRIYNQVNSWMLYVYVICLSFFYGDNNSRV